MFGKLLIVSDRPNLAFARCLNKIRFCGVILSRIASIICCDKLTHMACAMSGLKLKQGSKLKGASFFLLQKNMFQNKKIVFCLTNRKQWNMVP